MRQLLLNVKRYLLRPEVGAGLMYVALALGIVKLWLARLVAGGALSLSENVHLAWTLVSFAICAWLALLLLRRTLPPRALRRVLLVAAVHAAGALRFYDWGLVLLAVLPLFALAPAVLLATDRD